jgi:hypothetical protein
VVEPQVLLAGEQHGVHRPELARCRRGLSGLGGELGVRVHLVDGQVPPHVPDVGVDREQLALVADAGVCITAVSRPAESGS